MSSCELRLRKEGVISSAVCLTTGGRGISVSSCWKLTPLFVPIRRQSGSMCMIACWPRVPARSRRPMCSTVEVAGTMLAIACVGRRVPASAAPASATSDALPSVVPPPSAPRPVAVAMRSRSTRLPLGTSASRTASTSFANDTTSGASPESSRTKPCSYSLSCPVAWLQAASGLQSRRTTESPGTVSLAEPRRRCSRSVLVLCTSRDASRKAASSAPRLPAHAKKYGAQPAPVRSPARPVGRSAPPASSSPSPPPLPPQATAQVSPTATAPSSSPCVPSSP
mmetsp:Transcript_31653/g.83647  ORF Transcript_31653/g.83647 Transcript_31653/m.83647 type:complete len:281 (-) Transcript_31653:870-1712(-)